MEEHKSFDKLVSVGMVEHVGEEMLPKYFAQPFKLLRPGGVFLNHGIGQGLRTQRNCGLTFVGQYVFQGSYVFLGAV